MVSNTVLVKIPNTEKLCRQKEGDAFLWRGGAE